MKIIMLLLLFYSAFQSLVAQDISISMFSSSPTILNPAATGTFGNSNLRVHSAFTWNRHYDNFRENITSISVDKTLLKGKVGIGGDASYEFGTDVIKSKGAMLSTAYNTDFFNDNVKLSVGMQTGLLQNSMDWDYIVLMEPDDPILGQLKDKVLYPDLNLGLLMFRNTDNRNILPWIGFSVSHLFRTDISFNSEYSSTQPLKLMLHTGTDIPVNTHIILTPLFLFTRQDKLNTLDLGGIASYQEGKFSLSAGGIYQIYWTGSFKQHQQSLLAAVGFAGFELRLELLMLTDRVQNQPIFPNGTVGLSWNLKDLPESPTGL